jgi:hypothetical protein
MRNVVLALFALILAGTAAPAQTPGTNWAEKLFKDPIIHDFGSVPRGAQLSQRFHLTNIYAVPLEINTRVGCHCVTVTPSTRVLEPRQDGYIDILMDARRFSGPKTVPIYVTVGNGPQYLSTATLQVIANSRADVVLNPGQVNFGVVQRGQGLAQTIDVEYAGVLNWQLTDLVKHDAPLDVTFKELYRRPGQVGYRVTVALKPEVSSGPLKQELFLRTNDPAGPLVPILVEATVQASLNAVPSAINVGSLNVGDSLTKTIVVKANKPFRIVAVDGLGDGIKAHISDKPAALQVVKLECQALKAGALHRQFLIKTDLDQEGPITVTLDGTIVQP